MTSKYCGGVPSDENEDWWYSLSTSNIYGIFCRTLLFCFYYLVEHISYLLQGSQTVSRCHSCFLLKGGAPLTQTWLEFTQRVSDEQTCGSSCLHDTRAQINMWLLCYYLVTMLLLYSYSTISIVSLFTTITQL